MSARDDGVRDTSGSGTPPTDPPGPFSAELIRRVERGDEKALAGLFSMYQPRLWRVAAVRLHPRLQGRIDPEDVLQEAWLRARDRKQQFFAETPDSCFVWFRAVVCQTLIDLERRHLGAQKRNAGRELSLDGGWGTGSTSQALAFHLSGELTSPSNAVLREEMAAQIDAALQRMNEIDREVLALRHFEQLTNSETAQVLNLTEAAACARYGRALRRLGRILETMPGFIDDSTGPHRPND